ncbi:MAG: nucleotidyltransferase family protein [Gammaproteobacteria bacterium]|nr:nucleotidyltransferase family protein [Gammaproteobacteria bacterium]
MTAPRFTALVLAGQRAGERNPVAAFGGTTHKCVIPLRGRPMIGWVLSALFESSWIDRVIISIEVPELLAGIPEILQQRAAGRLLVVPSAGHLGDSVVTALRDRGDAYPVLVTTADNALLTPAMIDHFCTQVTTRGIDAAVALAPFELVRAAHPGSKDRSSYRLRDGGYSNCNLFGLGSAQALAGVELFRGGGQFGKKPRRVLGAVGPWLGLRYLARLVTLRGLERGLSRRFGVHLGIVVMPFADAPIDVDDVASYHRVERILAQRAGDREEVQRL